MLVLSRKESERIRVGDSIVVTVVRLTKDRVRLGIEAPEDVLVLRDELEKEASSDVVPETKIQSPAVCASSAPLARKMNSMTARRVPTGYGTVTLEEESKEVSELEAPRLRRCPERKYFRCD